ncbi:21852_t:CDS:2 [Rhizophagus irregularis]|nr:21852_t:CDS:2 [Rhizophagus irregularis]
MKLISSATFTNEYSPKVFHTVAPYWPYPDMFIPHKYRNIIPKDLIYNNKGNFIIPGSREWFTYMYNLHQSGTIPIPILTRQVTQSEYYAEQDLITTNQRKREETHERINKTFGTSFPRFMDQSSEVNRLVNKDHRAYIDHELKVFNENYIASTYGKCCIPQSELSDNTKELERRPNKRNPTMVPNNFFTS